MSYSTIAVIFNPNSTGPSERMARDFKKSMGEALPSQVVELLPTEYPGHGEKLAYDLAKSSSNPLIISSSGDGGYHEVVNGVMKAQQEGSLALLGLLPAGNANDHYRNVTQGDMIQRIVDNRPLKIDALYITAQIDGTVIKRYAHSYIGLGFTPFVAKQLNSHNLNPLSEAWIVLRSLFTITAIRLRLGSRTRRYDSVIFSNVDMMSKYLTISSRSSLSDGQFEVTAFRRRNRLQLVRLLIRASVKGVKEDQRTDSFSFKTIDSTLVQADGEVLVIDAQTEAAIGIERQALTCFI